MESFQMLRLKADAESPHAKECPKKGEIVFVTDRGGVKDGRQIVRDNAYGTGFAFWVPIDQLEPVESTSWRDFDRLFSAFFHGRVPIPNMEWVDPKQALNSIAAGGGLGCHREIGHVMLPGETFKTWARAFLSYTQGGQFDGTGYLVVYAQSWGEDQRGIDRQIARFAICKHVNVAGANARPERGWHPSRCSECDLDTTVDSGD